MLNTRPINFSCFNFNLSCRRRFSWETGLGARWGVTKTQGPSLEPQSARWSRLPTPPSATAPCSWLPTSQGTWKVIVFLKMCKIIIKNSLCFFKMSFNLHIDWLMLEAKLSQDTCFVSWSWTLTCPGWLTSYRKQISIMLINNKHYENLF